MSQILIDNGFFTREADAVRDAALLDQHQGEQVIYEELPDELRARMEYYTEQMRLSSYPAGRLQAFEREGFLAFTEAYETLFVLINWGLVVPKQVVPEEFLPLVERMKELRESLVQTEDPEKGIWYIWGNSMPHESVRSEADWRYSYDQADFRPFLIPFLQEDQTEVKGNIVIVSGGGYDFRSNRWEGFEAVPCFFKKGYNCFLLQRRISPYYPDDGAMDLQRSIRYLRAHADELGIGSIDRIAVNGYSGGGWCIMDMLTDHYADSSPDEFDSSYHPDETDQISSAVDAAMIVYGARFLSDEYRERFLGNPDLPPVFLVAAQEDFIDLDLTTADVYKAVSDLVPTELHIYARTQHGFGVGVCEDRTDPAKPVRTILANASRWPDDADIFLSTTFGIRLQ